MSPVTTKGEEKEGERGETTTQRCPWLTMHHKNSNLSSLILALSLLGGPADSTGGTSHWKLNARRLAIV